ncbi:SEFIR domain-containing protein [Lentzea sp. NPDC004782]|uniref:SEFIR domain-containing protein n=1 Tax=Lentzea sp. NPDC004782 TaxID=3154458 RepID=UPI0033B501AF
MTVTPAWRSPCRPGGLDFAAMVGPDRDAPPPKVFVAYTHDSLQHKADVLTLAALLMRNGVETELDQWAEGQPQDWGVWAHEHITGSDYTIIVASPQCKIAGDGGGLATENRGARAEMAVIRDLVQRDRATWRPKLLTVVLPGRGVEEIPDFLQPYAVDHYKIGELTTQGIEDLLRVIFKQPRTLRPSLGRPPVFSQLNPSLPVAAPLAAEPTWHVLPDEAEVVWRTGVESLAKTWKRQWPATLEVHLVPVGDARIPVSQLRSVEANLPVYAHAQGVLDVSSGVDKTSTPDVVMVSSQEPYSSGGGGMALLRNGQRSAWMRLREARLGSVLIREDAVSNIKTMLTALVQLNPALSANVVPVVGIDPVLFVRRGDLSDLTSNSASISMFNRSALRLRADEYLAAAELTGMTEQVAVELAERLLAEFPEPGR